MRITVLGKSPAWQDPGGACSGYLIEEGGVRLLLDCGNGVLGKLREVCELTELDAIVISHLHADHFIDLVPCSYALAHSPLARGMERRPRLLLPPDGRQTLRRITGCWNDEGLVERSFDLREYADGEEVELGPLRVGFREVPHFIRTHAVRVRSADRSFTYGADCRPNEEIVAFARDTDLLMLEAAVEQPEADGDRGHLTAAEAGDHARRAGARRLVVTHYSADVDPERIRAQAEGAFGGPVELAHEGATYTV